MVARRFVLVVLFAALASSALAARCPPPSVFNRVSSNFLRYNRECWVPLNGGFAVQLFLDANSTGYSGSCAIDSLYARSCSRSQQAPPFFQGTCTYQYIRLTGSRSSSWGRPIQIALATCSQFTSDANLPQLDATQQDGGFLVNGQELTEAQLAEARANAATDELPSNE